MARFECKAVGIDLGTTNTVISYYDEIGQRGECCVNREGTYLLSSAVYFEDSSSYVVGTVAREGALLYPERTAMFFKRKMGVSKEAITVDGKIFSPQQVSALVLKEAVESAREELEEEITDAVITVPAYFDSDARQATIEAGKMAGLNVLDTLDEPSAAICHYASSMNLKKDASQLVLIVDLGGGTLDLMAAEISETTINEIAINGDIHLGGADWDQAFVDYIKDKYLKEQILEPDDEQALLLDAEKAKKAFSRKEKTRLNISTRQGRVSVEVTRSDFDDCTSCLLERVREIIRKLMMDLFEMGISEFDKILMVGGATRMPQIERMLRELFPGTEIVARDQDEAVARGAAVYAKMISAAGNGKSFLVKQSFQTKKLNRISTRSYGLAVLLGENGERKICNMIQRSSELPAEKTKYFYTNTENQKEINLRVYETTSMEQYTEVDPEALLGNCILELTEDLPKGSEIKVIFRLSENGVLSLEGQEPRSGRSIRATMKSRALLENEEFLSQKSDMEQLVRAD